MDDYLCLTVLSNADEAQTEFTARLSAFWTCLLRTHPDGFEKVYAERTAFERDGNRWSRQYLIEAAVADRLEGELAVAGLGHSPLDRDDVFTKYEAAPPNWMQIEH